MFPLAFTLLTTSAICFSFKTTRGVGIVCLSLFCFIFPLAALALMVIAGLGYLVYRCHYR